MWSMILLLSHDSRHPEGHSIWQKATSLGSYVVCKRSLVVIFYYIRQVAARVAKLVLGVHLRPLF